MRHDHTAWLVHFVRDRKPEQDFPDEAGIFANGELEMDASAFDVLKTIVRLGGVLPGYSFRSGLFSPRIRPLNINRHRRNTPGFIPSARQNSSTDTPLDAWRAKISATSPRYA
jgi:hypothetical protein